ncbi:hypothetical protein Ancab_001410 [Ancistrocladus abbreviatus]
MARVLIAIEHSGSINDIVQLSVDNKLFNISVNEELGGANLFKHMQVYNVVERGINSGVAVSDRGIPRSSPVRIHDYGSKIQSCTPALISLEQKRMTEDLNEEAMQLEDPNREAMQLDGTEGSVGSLSKAIAGCAGGDEECAERSNHINDKICLFHCKTRGGNYLADLGLSVSRKGGERQNFELVRGSADGSMLVVNESRELEAEDALGFVAGPSVLKEEIWMGLGKFSSQLREAGFLWSIALVTFDSDAIVEALKEVEGPNTSFSHQLQSFFID